MSRASFIAPDVGEPQPVVFTTPMGTRVIGAIMRACLSMLLTLLVFGSLGGLATTIPGVQSQPWFVAAVFGLPPIACVLAYVLIKRRQPTRLTLAADRVRVGGRFLGRDVGYDDLALMKIERPEKTIGDGVVLTLRPVRGRQQRLWLRGRDADDCFHALRNMSEHVAAIGLVGETYLPGDPQHSAAGRAAVAGEHRRKARRALTSAVITGMLAVFAAASLLLGASNSRLKVRAWVWVAVMPIVSVASMGVYLTHKRRAEAMSPDTADAHETRP